MLRAFQEHPESVGETYIQHMRMSFGFGGRMLLAGLGCILHGIFPFLCVRTGSKTINTLHDAMVLHRTKCPPCNE